MKKHSVVRWLLPIAIIIVALVIAFILITSKKPLEQEPIVDKAFLVNAQSVYTESVDFTVKTQGNVIPKNQTKLSSQVSGAIVKVSPVFVEGGFFSIGDVLIELEQDDYLTEVKLAEAQLAQAEADLQEEIARGKVAEKEWRSVNSSAPPALGLREPQLAREQANVKGAQAQLERAKRNLSRTQIKAPYNGVVVQRDVDLGQFLPVGSVVGEVFSTDVAEVRLPITNSDLAFLHLDTGVSQSNVVNLSANVAGKLTQWEGKLVRSEGVLSTDSRVIYAIAEIDDPYMRKNTSEQKQALRYGQFVQATISGTQTEDVIVLPRQLVRLDNTVLTVSDNRTLAIKSVDILRSDEQHVYIGSGIDSGEQIVTSAVPNAYTGMKIRLPGDEPEIDTPSENDQPDDKNEIEPHNEDQ
ncbi:efflux RND transporter periplasmic adaptor subunit [Alteromonas sp. 5E99-2]|uniref:efflux RND transporter periplasmic adaptor subunit n=1 Tax=Alteromonas sp. 5E99-2 TaxID=2817683 RepID=UPI001A98698F|nr:efflux RND transporter periplasmic adaptor subunit [Alteromonas sp. 5E99-2]MBO1254847.1 efflux RND transporter periplasmic adaptor subunit [Alteromonas sp. 5E99-2]